jgi:hypothetical protein
MLGRFVSLFVVVAISACSSEPSDKAQAQRGVS